MVDSIGTKTIVAGVDIGNNLTNLLTKLAEKIGTSVDQVFPWYVTQSVVTGWIHIIIYLIFLIGSPIVFFKSYKKTDWDDGNIYSVLCVGSAVIFFCCLIYTCAGLTSDISMVINPKFNAIQQLLKSLGDL